MLEQCANTYAIMSKRQQIGLFGEEMTPVGLRFSIKLDMKLVKKFPYSLYVLQKNGYVEHDDIWFWIENRVTPRTQDGIEEKLIKMGLSEYNAYELLKGCNAFELHDDCWIKFNKSMTYDNTHPRAYIYGQ